MKDHQSPLDIILTSDSLTPKPEAVLRITERFSLPLESAIEVKQLMHYSEFNSSHIRFDDPLRVLIKEGSLDSSLDETSLLSTIYISTLFHLMEMEWYLRKNNVPLVRCSESKVTGFLKEMQSPPSELVDYKKQINDAMQKPLEPADTGKHFVLNMLLPRTYAYSINPAYRQKIPTIYQAVLDQNPLLCHLLEFAAYTAISKKNALNIVFHSERDIKKRNILGIYNRPENTISVFASEHSFISEPEKIKGTLIHELWHYFEWQKNDNRHPLPILSSQEAYKSILKEMEAVTPHANMVKSNLGSMPSMRVPFPFLSNVIVELDNESNALLYPFKQHLDSFNLSTYEDKAKKYFELPVRIPQYLAQTSRPSLPNFPNGITEQQALTYTKQILPQCYQLFMDELNYLKTFNEIVRTKLALILTLLLWHKKWDKMPSYTMSASNPTRAIPPAPTGLGFSQEPAKSVVFGNKKPTINEPRQDFGHHQPGVQPVRSELPTITPWKYTPWKYRIYNPPFILFSLLSDSDQLHIKEAIVGRTQLADLQITKDKKLISGDPDALSKLAAQNFSGLIKPFSYITPEGKVITEIREISRDAFMRKTGLMVNHSPQISRP
ncbi:MAG: hypothetical protein IPP74_07430 [Alphaproteobacteria bacterium]|nr:hypothetical protein [Alphaproteobacteria bacterium]